MSNLQFSFISSLPPLDQTLQETKEKKRRVEKATTSLSMPLVVRSCPICQKKFTRHWLLQGHIRTHSKCWKLKTLVDQLFLAGERPFKCQICSKAFADKSNLRAHVQTHSGKFFDELLCKKLRILKPTTYSLLFQASKTMSVNGAVNVLHSSPT